MPFLWYKTAMLGCKSRTGTRHANKGNYHLKLCVPLNCCSCPSATFVSQHRSFVQRKWQAAKGLLSYKCNMYRKSHCLKWRFSLTVNSMRVSTCVMILGRVLKVCLSTVYSEATLVFSSFCEGRAQ